MMCAIRVEVLEDAKIELLRITEGRIYRLQFDSLEKAVRVFAYLLKRDLRLARKERFVSDLDKECKRLLAEEIEARK